MDTEDTPRAVRYIPEEDESLIAKEKLVTTIGRLELKEAKPETVDPFSKDADILKSYSGNGRNLKRRISNELKKVNQSYDGSTQSKQINPEGSPLNGYNTYGVMPPPYNLDHLAQLYVERSGPHHAAVEAKIANIVGLGFRFVETPGAKRLLEEQQGNEKKLNKTRKAFDAHRDDLIDLFDNFHEEDTFTETLEKVWRDYETTGNGYIEIGRKRDGTIGYIGYIPSVTIRVRRDRDGFVQVSGTSVQYFANFGAGRDKETGAVINVTNPIGDDKPNEIIHLKNHSPSNTYYGIPDIVAAMPAVAANEFGSKFNLDYFEHKAVPRHLIVLKGAQLSGPAQNNILEFFQTNLKSQNHRSLFVPLPGGTKDNPVDLEIKAIEANVQDASFLNLKKMSDKEIFMVHRTPETKVSISGGGVNVAMAKDADKTFKEQVCGPKQKVLQKKLNRIVKEFTDTFELILNEMTLTDEDTQSKIDERRIKTGTETPNEQRLRRGQPGHPSGDELVDLNAKDKIAQAAAERNTTRERDSERSANGTDSNGESRSAKGEGRTTA